MNNEDEGSALLKTGKRETAEGLNWMSHGKGDSRICLL